MEDDKEKPRASAKKKPTAATVTTVTKTVPAKRITSGAIAKTMTKEAPKKSSVATKKAFLGVTLEEVISTGGIRVVSVEPGGPAESAGLQKDDEVIAIGGQSVKRLDTVRELLERHRPGQEMTVKVKRDGKELELAVTLGSF